jgi:hypothetical protein
VGIGAEGEKYSQKRPTGISFPGRTGKSRENRLFYCSFDYKLGTPIAYIGVQTNMEVRK